MIYKISSILSSDPRSPFPCPCPVKAKNCVQSTGVKVTSTVLVHPWPPLPGISWREKGLGWNLASHRWNKRNLAFHRQTLIDGDVCPGNRAESDTPQQDRGLELRILHVLHRKIAPGHSVFAFISFWNSLQKFSFYLFIYVILTPSVGLELATPISRVACSSKPARSCSLQKFKRKESASLFQWLTSKCPLTVSSRSLAVLSPWTLCVVHDAHPPAEVMFTEPTPNSGRTPSC